MKTKLNWSVVIEVGGLVAATCGLAMLSVPVALVALGSFLVWSCEKGA
jgi:hypothetical protein